MSTGFRMAQRFVSTQPAATPACSALIHEVTPRDGLQNEKMILSTNDKVELIRLIVASQPASIELTSFVRPDLVPAMADGAELVRRVSGEYEEWIHSMANSLPTGNSVQHFMALLPNMRAFETFHELRMQDNCVLDTAVCLVRYVILVFLPTYMCFSHTASNSALSKLFLFTSPLRLLLSTSFHPKYDLYLVAYMHHHISINQLTLHLYSIRQLHGFTQYDKRSKTASR